MDRLRILFREQSRGITLTRHGKNCVAGTKKERGLHTRDPDFYFEDGNDFSVSGKDAYELPGMNCLAKIFPWLRLLPFIPKENDADTNPPRKLCE